MKKIVIVFALLFPLSLMAAECYVPKDCVIISSEFSTGGGDNVSYVMEVDCKLPAGLIVKYTHWEVSVGGFFGVGRFTMPRKINFKRHNQDSLVCNY